MSGLTIAILIMVGTVVGGVLLGELLYKLPGYMEARRNRKYPVVTKNVVIFHKRTYISHYATSYYITFETSDGERLEFEVTGSDFGMAVEGERFQISYQGTALVGVDFYQEG